MKIELHGKHGEGRLALIDPDDFPKVSPFKWWVQETNPGSGTYYAYSWRYTDTGQRKVFMHRLVTDAPRGKQVHHRNWHTLDNRRNNLIVCTQGENLEANGMAEMEYQEWCEEREAREAVA